MKIGSAGDSNQPIMGFQFVLKGCGIGKSESVSQSEESKVGEDADANGNGCQRGQEGRSGVPE